MGRLSGILFNTETMTMNLTKIGFTTNGVVSLWQVLCLSRVIDAYEGKPMFTLAGYQNNKVKEIKIIPYVLI